MARRDEPAAVLTRHFFSAFFDFGFLTQEGRESFVRVLLGCCAVAGGLGLLLVRIFAGKYAGLADPDEYLSAVAADHAFLIALPMWVVACAVALAGHAVFPGETDFRVLMPEPVTRGTIFRAKLGALLGFCGLFMAGTQLALTPLFALTMLGPGGTGSLPRWCVAHALSSVAASGFAATAMVALHGALLLMVPRARLLSIAAAIRSALVCALVLALLAVIRLPAAGPAFASNAGWLYWAPPAWFVALEQWLLGRAGWGPLALEGIVAWVAVAGVSAAVYATLYRRFDRAMARPGASYPPRREGGHAVRRRRGASVRRALAGFVMTTLRRSTMHQGIVVTLTAAAAGLVGTAMLEAWPPWAGGDRWLLFWSPLALMFVAAPAVRLSLCVPIDLRANWIFRMTEAEDRRCAVTDAGVQTVFAVGVVVPAALVMPLQWAAFGAGTLRLIAVELTLGWAFVEFLMRDWRRIPFTCSYIPGKGFVPHMFVKGIASFLLCTNLGAALLRAVAFDPVRLPVAVAVIAAPALLLRAARRRHAPSIALLFEDEVPSEVNPLRLNPD